MQTQLRWLLWIYAHLLRRAYGIPALPETLDFNGVNIMIRVPADQPDVTFAGTIDGKATDSEGNMVDVSFVAPSTDNPSAFDFTDVQMGDDGLSFKATGHTGAPQGDGSPALATIKFAVKRDDTGAEVWQQAHVVQVSAGAPQNIPVSIDLGGLVDEPDTPVAEPVA